MYFLGSAKVSNLSERLIKLHNEKGNLKKNIAEAIGVSSRQYKRYESGEQEPTAGILVKLADFYNVTTDYLLGLSDVRERR